MLSLYQFVREGLCKVRNLEDSKNAVNCEEKYFFATTGLDTAENIPSKVISLYFLISQTFKLRCNIPGSLFRGLTWPWMKMRSPGARSEPLAFAMRVPMVTRLWPTQVKNGARRRISPKMCDVTRCRRAGESICDKSRITIGREIRTTITTFPKLSKFLMQKCS